jgi:hypothetical protein
MADLTPHPLVSIVVAGLIEQGVAFPESPGLSDAVPASDALAAGAEASADITREEPEPAKRDTRAFAKQASQGLARASGLPELVTFAGYVGATLPKGDADTDHDCWTVLYLDSHLQTWLLVHTKGIVYRDAAHDKQAPLKQRDILWVRADTAVGRGDGSLTVQSQFLTGAFTQAGDFDSGPSGGTLAAATGVFCEARSVNCCRPQTPR